MMATVALTPCDVATMRAKDAPIALSALLAEMSLAKDADTHSRSMAHNWAKTKSAQSSRDAATAGNVATPRLAMVTTITTTHNALSQPKSYSLEFL